MSFVQKSEKKWTEEEDDILRVAVAEYGKGAKINWQKISDCLSGRSNKSCRKRWIHSLDPGLRKGRWTAAEDSVLLDSVAMHGQNWSKVARHVDGRTDDQCAKRWRENLDPSISREPWSSAEDQTLLHALKVHGQKWNTISTLLPGRASVHCRNRYSRLRRARDSATSHQGSTSAASSPSCTSSPRSETLSVYPSPVENRSKRLPDELLRLNIEPGVNEFARKRSAHASVPNTPVALSPNSNTGFSPVHRSRSYSTQASSSTSGLNLLSTMTPPAGNELSNRLLDSFVNDADLNRDGKWYPQPGDNVFLFSSTDEQDLLHMPDSRSFGALPGSDMSLHFPPPANQAYHSSRSYLGSMAEAAPLLSGMDAANYLSMPTDGVDSSSNGDTQRLSAFADAADRMRDDRAGRFSSSGSHLSMLDPFSRPMGSMNWPMAQSHQRPSDGRSGQLPQRTSYDQQSRMDTFEMPALDSTDSLSISTLSSWLSMNVPTDNVHSDNLTLSSPSTSTADSESSPLDDGYSTIHRDGSH